jgi:hypothetical protein
MILYTWYDIHLLWQRWFSYYIDIVLFWTLRIECSSRALSILHSHHFRFLLHRPTNLRANHPMATPYPSPLPLPDNNTIAALQTAAGHSLTPYRPSHSYAVAALQFSISSKCRPSPHQSGICTDPNLPTVLQVAADRLCSKPYAFSTFGYCVILNAAATARHGPELETPHTWKVRTSFDGGWTLGTFRQYPVP